MPGNIDRAARRAYLRAHPDEAALPLAGDPVAGRRAAVIGHLDGDHRNNRPENLFRYYSRADFVRACNTFFKLLPALYAAGLVTTIDAIDPASGCPSTRYVLAPGPQAPGTFPPGKELHP